MRIIITADGHFQIAAASGALIRTTAGRVFETPDAAAAQAALAFLVKPLRGGKRTGSRQMKSMFGAF